MNPSHYQDIARLERTLAEAQAELTRLKTTTCSPIAAGHNPDSLTEEQVGVKEGWRLLTLAEIEYRKAQKLYSCTPDIHHWAVDGKWTESAFGDGMPNCTYRTLKPAGWFGPPVVVKPGSKLVACDNATGSAVADPMEDVKVGDYVTCIETYEPNPPRMREGSMYRVTSVDRREEERNVGISVTTDPRDLWHSRRFRPATRPEIEAFLLKEAAELGFVVGARAKWTNGQTYLIDRVSVAFPDDSFLRGAPVQEHLRAANRPVAIVHERTYTLPVNQHLVLIKEDPIVIVVDGTTYTADFKTSGIVTFGCAKIAAGQIKVAHSFLSNSTGFGGHASWVGSNRETNAVRIGKGVFDLPLLEKLVARLDAK